MVVRPPGTRIAHSFRAGPNGLTMLIYGTRKTNDMCWYPRSNKIFWRGLGVIGRIESLDYYDGEPDDDEEQRMKLGLHVARFTYPGGPPTLADDLRRIVIAGEAAGYDRISVMDHVWQIHVERPARAGDARALHRARLHGRPHQPRAAADAGDGRRLPAAGPAGQDGDHARRAVRGARHARHRRRLERGGVAGAGAAVPAHLRALRAAGGDAPDLPADVERLRAALPGRATTSWPAPSTRRSRCAARTRRS